MSAADHCSCGDRASPVVRCARCGLHIDTPALAQLDLALGDRMDLIRAAAADVLELAHSAQPDSLDMLVSAIAGLLDERFGPALSIASIVGGVPEAGSPGASPFDPQWLEATAAKLCSCGGKLRVPCPLAEHRALLQALRTGIRAGLLAPR